VKAEEKVLNEDLTVDIDGWKAKAKPGDVLEVIAVYRFDAGVYTNHSHATSQRFIVTA
jgi:hypothetical protein